MTKFPCDNNPAFKNAIKWLHEHRDVSSVGDVINAFKTEFNGYVFLDNNWDWETFTFANDKDATMFVMRFS